MRLRSARHALLLAALFCLPWLVGVGGWQYRNWRQTGSAEFSAVEGIDWAWYRGAAVVAARDGITLAAARAQLGLPDDPWTWLAKHQAEQPERQWKHLGVRLWFTHPLLAARVTLAGAFWTCASAGDNLLLQLMGVPVDLHHGPLGDLARLPWSEYMSTWVCRQPGALAAAVMANLHLLAVYAGIALFALAACRSRDRRKPDIPAVWARGPNGGFSVAVILGMIALYLLLAAGTPAASYRFRVPLMPIFCLLAGAGWSRAGRSA